MDSATDVRQETWALDSLGNWSQWRLDADADGSFAGAADLDQTRTHNAVNEIYNATAGNAITQSAGQAAWVDPAYDTAGNAIPFRPKRSGCNRRLPALF